MQATAILFTGVNQVAVDRVEVPEPGPGEVMIEAAYTCISPGTELRCLRGEQAGNWEWPFIPGYSLTGRVVAAGPNTKLAVGAPVYCTGTRHVNRSRLWGGHISHAVLPEREVYVVPENMKLLEASAARLAAIAYHGLRLSHPLPQEKVAVIGLGPVGQFAARLHAIVGAHVVGADLQPQRVALLRNAGIAAVVPGDGLANAFREFFPNGADVVVDATGAAEVLGETLDIAREKPWDDSPTPGARVVIQGSYPGALSIPYQKAFTKELSFWLPRDVQPQDLRAVLDLIYRNKLQARDVVSDVRPPQDAAETYAELRKPRTPLLTVAFEWR